MNIRRKSVVVVVVALLLGTLNSVTNPAGAEHGDALVHDEPAFRDALGDHTFQDFEAFEAGTFITTQVPGVTFSTPGEPLYVFQSPSTGGKSLFGGFQREATSAQTFRAAFAEPASAVGFSLTAQDPASTAASLAFTYTDNTTTVFSILDNDANENTPQYLGFTAPDGKTVASFELNAGIENVSGLAEEIAIDNLAFATAATAATPATALIVFGGRDPVAGDRDVFLTDVNGSSPQNLTAGHGGLDSDPEISPDGSKIVFASTRASGGDFFPDIWVMNIDGTGLVNLTPDTAAVYDADPTWSPDGAFVAFARDPGDGFDIFVVPSTGGAARQVTNGDSLFGGGFPSWSPDGTRIAYRSDRSDDMEIWESNLGTIDVDLVERNLTNHPGGDNTPSYSPDGTQIAFFRENPDTGHDLFVMPAGGGEATPVLVQPGDDEFPQWSPDGGALVFDTGPNGTGDHDIKIVDLATGAVRAVASNGNAADWGRRGDARDLSLTVSANQTLPGASFVDPGAIPVTDLPLNTQEEVADTPLRSVDIATSPLRSVPLRSVPLRSVPLRSVPLRSVLLSDIPLRSVDTTWEDILADTLLAGLPLQVVTLDQVLALEPPPPDVAALTLDDVDLASTPLRSVSMVSLAMGSTPLRSVPLRSVSDEPLPWCDLVGSLGYSCADLGITENSPILALDLAGIPLRSVPLRSVPLRSVPLRSVDLAAANLGVESAPLRSVPLRSVPLRSVPLGGVPIDALDTTKVGSIVNCEIATCATLADAQDADALVDGVTLGDVFDALDREEIPGTLLEMLQGLIAASDYAWESLPVERLGVQDHAGEGAPVLTYTAAFTVVAGGSGTARVDLPAGFRYVADSTSPASEDSPDVGEPNGAPSSPEWTIAGVAPGDTVTWSFDVRPSLSLKVGATSVLRVDLGGVPVSVASQAPVTVVEDFGDSPGSSTSAPNDDPAGAAEIAPNTLVLSHIGKAGDVDYFKLPVPPRGTRIQVRLGSESTDADFDVALLNGAAAAPLRSVPLRSVPLRSVPLPDNGLTADAADAFVSAETLDDIPGTDVVGTPLRSVSQNRTTADELIDTTSNIDQRSTDPYLIQVTAYNGGSSAAPYALYVKQYEPPDPPQCAARTAPTYPSADPPTSPRTVPASAKTLILTSPARLAHYSPSAWPSDPGAKTPDDLAGARGVDGVVYPIESDPDVVAALGAWDTNPCSPDAANAVVSEIGEIVDDVRQTATGLENIVIVGGDDVIPMGRIADYTQLSNESDYLSSVLNADGKANAVAAAVATQNILSDDPYGDLDPIPWLDHFLYVPELAVGRLIETPADISAQIAQYIASGGVLDPETALTTGYDFLSDGATEVDRALRAQLPNGAQALINDGWTRDDVDNALFPPDPDAGDGEPGPASPGIVNVNAHYDHSRSLPAAGNATGDESDLFGVADVADPTRTGALLNRILFTMGCHAGLNVPDSYGAQTSADWAQTFLGTNQTAAVYFANTGFGYGDTAAVALSERLMQLFAERLDGSLTVGQAAAFAKQAYFGSMGTYGPYDEKAMQEATFYGLPMYRIDGSETAPTAPTTVTPGGGNVPGVQSVPIDLDLTDGVDPRGDFVEKSVGETSYYTVGTGGTLEVDGADRAIETGDAQLTQYRPIVPRTSAAVTSATAGQVAKGFLVTGLTSEDTPASPAVARPVVDLTANEAAPPAGDIAFPASLSNVSSFAGPNGAEQKLVLLPGQVFRDAGDPTDAAVQRLFTRIAGEVTYGAAGALDDVTQPFLTEIRAEITDGDLLLSALVSDDSPVARVIALVREVEGATPKVWRPVELIDPDADGRYTGVLPDVAGAKVEYFVQAADAAGNVGLSTNKARYFSAQLRLVTDPETPNGSNGFYTGPVSVAIDPERPLTSYTMSVNGTAPQPYEGPVELAGDGVYEVRAAGDDGGRGSLTVRIDATPPTVSVTAAGVGGGTAPTCFAADRGSGLEAPCSVSVSQVDGTVVVTATARDRAGNSASAVATAGEYRFAWEGFFSPVDNLPVVNVAKAGSTIPVKFRLRDLQGEVVTSTAAVASILPTADTCSTAAALDTVETVTSDVAGLRYDAASQSFVYTWKTDKAWANQCRRLTVTLTDRTVQTAAFTFKK